jgi:lipopolysaccharide cholinephosphotransferase
MKESNTFPSKDKKIKLAQRICLELLIIVDNICNKNDLIYWLDGGTLLGAYRHKGFIPWDDDVDICVPLEHYHVLIDKLIEYCKNHSEKIVFYADTNFRYWHECFGDIRYLIDGALPVKIDIIPIKYLENNEESINEDKSLTNIAMYYIQGRFKHPDHILDKHKKYLPKGKNLVKEKNLFFERFNNTFLNNEASKKDIYLIKYLYSDACVRKDRKYLNNDVIFLISKILFEGILFNSPKNVHSYLEMLYGGNYMDLPPVDQREPHFYTIISNSKVKKKKIKRFIYLLHHYGFINLA